MSLYRPHHYHFAHRLLPALFHKNPEEFIALLQRDGLRFFTFLWERARQDLPRKDHLSVDGLGYKSGKLDKGWLVVVVALPPPKEMTEAFFVALALKPQPAAAKPTTRVFTLELGFSLDGKSSHTVLCEWTSESNHLNRGIGPAPDLKAFLAAIQPLL